MATGIMAGICTSSYPIEKVGDSPSKRDGFGQYPRGRVYLSSIVVYSGLNPCALVRGL